MVDHVSVAAREMRGPKYDEKIHVVVSFSVYEDLRTTTRRAKKFCLRVDFGG